MKEVNPFEFAEHFCKNDCVVVCGSEKLKWNPITIGWKTLGILWSKNVVTIAVHPSRFSYKMLNEGNGWFSVNFFDSKHSEILDICGSKTGKNTDKFQACNTQPEFLGTDKIPSFKEAELIYICKIIHTAESGNITKHRLYIGEIQKVFASEDLKK